MKNHKLIVLIAVGCIAVLSVIRGIVNFSKGAKATSEPGAVITQTAPRNPPLTTTEGTGLAGTKYLTWGRNPFVAAEAGSRSEAAGLSLSGIAWEANRAQAVINGRIVGVGDEVAGNKVVEINQNSVVLNEGSNRLVLRLWRKQ